MKPFLILIFALFFQPNVFAGELQDNMKELGKLFSSVAKQIMKENSITESTLVTIENCQDILELVFSKNIFPDTANTPELKMEYSKLMQETISANLVLIDEVKNSLSTGNKDLSKVKEALLTVNTLKGKAHDKFDPES